jgi:hypothetical protein
MSYLAIFKRIIPFFLTFAAGLLIASIFVPITSPSFRGMERGKRFHNKQLKMENDELRRENCRMKKELEALREIDQNWDSTNLKYAVPEIQVEAPPPPAPPVKRSRN